MAPRMGLQAMCVLLLVGLCHVCGQYRQKFSYGLDVIARDTIPVVPSYALFLNIPLQSNSFNSYPTSSQFYNLGANINPRRLPRTKCDRVNEYNANSEACCGQTVTLPGGTRCCQGKVYEKKAQFCYRGEVRYYLDYNPMVPTRVSCGGVDFNVNDQACCAGQIYDPDAQGCCNNNKVFKYATEMCLSGQVRVHNAYAPCPGFATDHPSQYGCCNGVSYLYSTQGCCQGNVYDLDQSRCAKDRLVAHLDRKRRCGGNVFVESFLGCCQGILYDINKQTCCEGRILNATSMYCQNGEAIRRDGLVLCGGMQYDPTRFGCCHGEPFDPSVQGCCAYTVFAMNEYTCNNGYLFPISVVNPQNQKPYCNNEEFDPSTGKRCCGKQTYKTGFESCCGQFPYIRSKQVCCESDTEQYFRRARMVGCRKF